VRNKEKLGGGHIVQILNLNRVWMSFRHLVHQCCAALEESGWCQQSWVIRVLVYSSMGVSLSCVCLKPDNHIHVYNTYDSVCSARWGHVVWSGGIDVCFQQLCTGGSWLWRETYAQASHMGMRLWSEVCAKVVIWGCT